MGAIKVYFTKGELLSVGASCVLVAIAASSLPEDPAQVAIADQLREHADDLLRAAPMDPTGLKDFGISLIARAQADG